LSGEQYCFEARKKVVRFDGVNVALHHVLLFFFSFSAQSFCARTIPLLLLACLHSTRFIVLITFLLPIL
jgi:hypothetical protein